MNILLLIAAISYNTLLLDQCTCNVHIARGVDWKVAHWLTNQPEVEQWSADCYASWPNEEPPPQNVCEDTEIMTREGQWPQYMRDYEDVYFNQLIRIGAL